MELLRNLKTTQENEGDRGELRNAAPKNWAKHCNEDGIPIAETLISERLTASDRDGTVVECRLSRPSRSL